MRTLQEWHQIKTHLWLREVLLTRPSLPEFLRVDLIPSHAGQPCRGPIIRLQQTGALVRHTASYSFQANRQAIRKSQIAVSPDRIRGRVMSVYAMVLLGVGPVGAYLSGLLIDLFGGRWGVAVMGGLTLLSALALVRFPWPRSLSPVRAEASPASD